MEQCISSASAQQKIAGRLQWSAQQVFGRVGRVYLTPLYKHAHGYALYLCELYRKRAVLVRRSSHFISGRVRRALQWWLQYLQKIPSRVVPLLAEEKPRVLIWSDATGKGRLAYVIQGSDS